MGCSPLLDTPFSVISLFFCHFINVMAMGDPHGCPMGMKCVQDFFLENNIVDIFQEKLNLLKLIFRCRVTDTSALGEHSPPLCVPAAALFAGIVATALTAVGASLYVLLHRCAPDRTGGTTDRARGPWTVGPPTVCLS